MSDEVTPMRVQLLTDDGTEKGVWLTVFEGWADLPRSARAADEGTALAMAIKTQMEEDK